MKVSIKNLLGLQRNLSKANGVTFSITPYGHVQLVDQDKHEQFYLGYNKNNCLVHTQLEEVNEEIVEVVNEKQVEQQIINEPLKVEINETPKQEIVIEPSNLEETQNTTPEVISDEELNKLLNELSVEQLKSVANNLGIVTSSNKASTIINKIFDATNDNQVILDTVNSIKGDA